MACCVSVDIRAQAKGKGFTVDLMALPEPNVPVTFIGVIKGG